MRMFPGLARINIVRAWSAQRVMTKDSFPILTSRGNFPALSSPIVIAA